MRRAWTRSDGMSCVCETRRRLRQLVGGFKDASPPCTHDRRLSPKTTHANLRPPMYPVTVRSTRAILVTEEDRAAHSTRRFASWQARATRRKRAVWAQPRYTRTAIHTTTPTPHRPAFARGTTHTFTAVLAARCPTRQLWGQQPQSPLC
jgi:hypothetical protein